MTEQQAQANTHQRTAKFLIAFGCLVLLTGSVLHLAGGYPRVAAALAQSNLNPSLKSALQSVFLLVAATWIVVAVVALVATFVKSQASKLIVLLCGFGLLLEIPVWVGVMGWFIGNEMFLFGAGLVTCGGLLFRDGRLPRA